MFLTLEMLFWYTFSCRFLFLFHSLARKILSLALSLPESTLLYTLILNSFISFRIRVYEKMGVGLVMVNQICLPHANLIATGYVNWLGE
jgi:hypothetical protein